jgi:hypothetical protein
MTAGSPIELNPYSNTCSVTTGIPEEKLPDNYFIYPNPSVSTVNIEQLSNEPIDIFMYDLTGKKVFSRHSESSVTELSITNLENGIYHLQINNGYKIYSTKFIIQK